LNGPVQWIRQPACYTKKILNRNGSSDDRRLAKGGRFGAIIKQEMSLASAATLCSRLSPREEMPSGWSTHSMVLLYNSFLLSALDDEFTLTWLRPFF
jgi:hypothetical protein